MGTAPNGYNTPKTNWQAANVVTPTDMNRIEGNIQAVEEGSRTIDPAQVPTSNTGSLRQLLDWFANRIKAITGKTNWYDAPSKTLEDLNTHINNTNNPHAVTPAQIGAVDKAGDTMTGDLTVPTMYISKALGGNNQLYEKFIATDGKQYGWVLRTDGKLGLYNYTDSVWVIELGPGAGQISLNGNTVWHKGNLQIQAGAAYTGSTVATYTVTFPTAFSKIPSVVITPISYGGISERKMPYLTNISTTGFSFRALDAYTYVYWVAVAIV